MDKSDGLVASSASSADRFFYHDSGSADPTFHSRISHDDFGGRNLFQKDTGSETSGSTGGQSSGQNGGQAGYQPPDDKNKHQKD